MRCGAATTSDCCIAGSPPLFPFVIFLPLLPLLLHLLVPVPLLADLLIRVSAALATALLLLPLLLLHMLARWRQWLTAGPPDLHTRTCGLCGCKLGLHRNLSNRWL